MPRIAPQHAFKNAEHVTHLRSDWPEDCTVQWGASGVVLGGKSGARKTAFFEAFPKDGGFIRGEGESIREAEDAAFRRFETQSACTHLWGRGKYTNGGCTCRRCGAFESRMKPITKLGRYRDPLSAFEIEVAIQMRGLGPCPEDDAGTNRFGRWTWLRLRRAGFDLPPMPERPEPEGDDPFENLPYARACREIIFARLQKIGGLDLIEGRGNLQSIGGFFDAMSFTMIKWEYREWLEERAGASEPAPGP